MSVIKKKIRLEGSKGKEEILTLFDSGSTYSCIQKDLAKKLEVLTPLPKTIKFGTAGDQTLEAKYRISIDFYINSDRFSDEFMVIEGLSKKTCPVGRNDRIGVLIGASTLQKWRMKLDFENDDILYNPDVTELQII